MSQHIWRPTDELAEMRIDGAVTFAATVLQSLDIDHMDAATTIADQTSLLQLARDESDAAPLHTEHLRQELLRKRQRVTVQQIAGLQKPAAQTLFQLVQCIACGDLLRLGGQYVLLPHQCDAQSFALLGGPFQHAGFDHRTGTVGLTDRCVECNLSIESRASANHAVPAQHTGLDELPGAEAHDERNDSTMRKIHTLDRALSFEDDGFSRDRHLLEMWEDQVPVGGGQR